MIPLSDTYPALVWIGDSWFSIFQIRVLNLDDILLRFSTPYLWQWVSTHLAVESDAHSLYDPVVFDRRVKGRLHCLLICCSHHQLSILCHQLSVGNPHDTELNLLDDPLFKG